MSWLLDHIVILPVLVPLAAAVLILMANGTSLSIVWQLSLGSALLVLAIAVYMLFLADDGTVRVYRLGDWPAPYGIVMVLDRVSAIMLAITAVIGLAALHQVATGIDAQAKHFHALFQLQLAGLNGAFLTGDLFNLFVFFEVLLLASYALLMHGAGAERTRAGMAYVVLNLAGSAVFLIALGLIYGTLGTLNLADIALLLPQVSVDDMGLVGVSIVLLFTVFLLKAAIIPMSFWLPRAYSAASAPVAVLFAVMTKLGIYALLRVYSLSADAEWTRDLAGPWLMPLAVATILIGIIGALAASRLSVIIANLILISSGTLLAAVAVNDVDATAAALYYLVQSTLIASGLFLVVDVLAHSRGPLKDTIGRGREIPSQAVVGGAFLILAIGASGLPPMSGFVGKLMILQSVLPTEAAAAVWTAILISGLVVALVLARAGSILFWQTKPEEAAQPAPAPQARATLSGLVLLAATGPLLALAAAPATDYAQAAAAQMHARGAYIGAVLGASPDIKRERRP